MYFPKVLKPRPIFFDLGDTLINFQAPNSPPSIREGVRLAYEFMADQGIKLPPINRYVRICLGATYLAYGLSVMRRREVDLLRLMRRVHRWLRLPEEYEFLLTLAERFYEPIKSLAWVEEGVHQVLDSLVEGGHPLAIVSNTMVPGQLLDQHLEDEDLLKYFPVRIYSCEIGVRKPDARAFRAALQPLNVKPQNTVFVGDQPQLDVKGAQQLGMISVLKVRRGSTPNGRYQPDYTIKHLSELPQLLDQVGRQYYDSTLTLLDATPGPSSRVWLHLPAGPSSRRIRTTPPAGIR